VLLFSTFLLTLRIEVARRQPIVTPVAIIGAGPSASRPRLNEFHASEVASSEAAA
jgi:hypothetical protein